MHLWQDLNVIRSLTEQETEPCAGVGFRALDDAPCQEFLVRYLNVSARALNGDLAVDQLRRFQRDAALADRP